VEILCSKLGLSLLLARHLLLLQFLHLELQLVEVQRSLLFGPVQLFSVKLLQAAVLFDALL